MLRRNVAPAKGLVNGATGTLKEIVKTEDGEAVGLQVDFDGIGIFLIEKVL